MKYKNLKNIRHTEDGITGMISVRCNQKGVIFTTASFFKENITPKRLLRKRIRHNDWEWVLYNIPSSIAWKTVIHHDWEAGARMRLITPEEHRKIHHATKRL